MEKGPGNEGTGTGEMKCSMNDISEQSEKKSHRSLKA